MRRVEPVLAGAAGLALTGFTAWEFHLWESRHRREAFVQLAAVRTEAVAQTLHAIADAGLEGLARFYENSSEVTEEEFRQFTPYLAKNRAVQAWVWVPEVPVTGLSQFQAEARAKASAGFEVWEKDAQGRRAPAGGRAMYYPVLHVAPLAGNELAAGYDLGSEPARLAALEEAARTGLATATDPVTLVQEPGSQKGLLILRPVFASGSPPRLRGFAAAAVRVGTLIGSASLDNSVRLELSFLRKTGPPEPLAGFQGSVRRAAALFSAARPVLAFGKVFMITARPGPDFIRLRPVWAGATAGAAGLGLTGAMSVVLGLVLSRRQELERVVAERTAALRASEESYQQTSNRLSLAARAGGVGIWDYDVPNNLLVWDDQMFRLYGIGRDQFTGAYQAWQGRGPPGRPPAGRPGNPAGPARREGV